MANPGEYVCERVLKAIDVDIGNHWKASAIFAAGQEIAGAHSQILHCARDELAAQDAFFVLMRQTLRMERYPSFGDRVHVTTWAFLERTVFPRCFAFCDDDGRLLGTLSTIWMLCSLSDRKILNPSAFGIAIPATDQPPLEKPGKLRFEGEPDAVFPRISQYSDMDYNGHVNNTRYADWVCDLFDPQRFCENRLAELQINYVAELRGREALTLSLREEGARFSVLGKSDADGHTIFQAAGRWDEQRGNAT